MSSPVAPQVIARLNLFSADEGGKGLPPRPGDWRTILTVGSESFSARVAASTEQALEPGVVAEAAIQFLVPDAALPKFKPGVQFKIWEGKDVGTGEVLRAPGTSNTSLERTREG
jgi:hypothetical protein